MAKLLPYASSVSALIEVPNVEAFKRKGVEKASKILSTELEELQNRIKIFVTEANNTQRVYAATYKFEPIVGETYHLYEGSSGTFFPLSLLANGKNPMEAIGLLRILNGKSSPTNKQSCPTQE